MTFALKLAMDTDRGYAVFVHTVEGTVHGQVGGNALLRAVVVLISHPPQTKERHFGVARWQSDAVIARVEACGVPSHHGAPYRPLE